MSNDVIPCHRGGHACSWPACPQDCDGRPGRAFIADVAEIGGNVVRDSAAELIEDDYETAIWSIEKLQELIARARRIQKARLRSS